MTARDVHGQSAVVAAHVFGDGRDASPSPRTSRWSSRCARAGASGSARPLAAALDHHRLGVGSRRHARAFHRRVRACRISGRSRSAPPTAWPRRRSRSRSSARTSPGVRSRSPADQTFAGKPRLDRSCPPVRPLAGESTCEWPRPTERSAPIEFRSPSQLSRYIGAELSLTDDGYFVTGDIGLMDDGELFVIGRGDEVIVVAGRNVYPDRHRDRGRSTSPSGGVASPRSRRPTAGSRSSSSRARSCRSRSSKPRAARSARHRRAKRDGRRRRSRSCRAVRCRRPRAASSGGWRSVRSLAADEGLLARVDFG